MTAAQLQTIAAEARQRTLLIQGATDQARLMGYIPVQPKEKP
jgi:hypothetical protein